jgi:hypothetical protein
MVNIRVWRLNEAAKEYDSRLMVGRNEQNGYWTVYIAMGPLQPPFPVLALTRDEGDLPEPEGLKRKLYQMDTVRHGSKMLDDMNRHNEQLKYDKWGRAADDATEEMADAFAWGHSRMTNDIGKKRISIKMNEPAHRRRLTTR